MTEISIFSEEQTSNMEQSFAYAQEDISGVMVLKKTLFNHFNHSMVGSHHLLAFSKLRSFQRKSWWKNEISVARIQETKADSSLDF